MKLNLSLYTALLVATISLLANPPLNNNAIPLYSTDTLDINVNTEGEVVMPTAQFFLNPALGCTIPHNVFFIDQSSGADTWTWDFGDGSALSTDQNPSHTYTTVGIFTVTLTVLDSATGLIDTATDTVTVTSTNTDFNGSPVIGCGPLLVDFVDLSTVMGGTIVSWLWEFGDGQTSGLQHPTHLYDLPGMYDVILTVSTDNGCMSALTRNNYVNVLGPTPAFSATPTSGNAPLTVDFTDNSTYGAPAQSWLWDFGNGDFSTQENPTYIYTSGCGEFDITLTVTDINGCPRTLVKPGYIQLTDNNLSIVCPPDLEEDANSNCEYVLSDYTGLADVTGNCSPVTITQMPPSGTPIPLGGTTITLTVSDGINTASCTFEVNISDVTAPQINCGGDRFEDFNANCEFVIPDYAANVSVSDACDQNVQVSQSPPAGTVISGITTVTFTSTDNSGNQGTCSFDVIPNDSTPPVIFCPDDQTEFTDDNCEFTVPDYRPNVIATDNCGTPVVTQDPTPGTIVNPGITQITMTASDGINVTMCSFNIMVENDNILVVSCPDEQFGVADAACTYILPDYRSLASYNGNCGNVTLTQNPIPGSIISFGDNTITIIATDGAGNTSCTFNVYVADQFPPEIICPQTQNESLDENCLFSIPDYSNLAQVSDSCGTPTVSQAPAIGTVVMAGSTVITLIADDGFNQATCTFEIIVSDTMAPTIITPDDFTTPANSNCLYYIPNFIPDVNVYDNCMNNPSIMQDPPAGNAVGLGETEITFFASDGANTGSESFTVTVIDITPPTIICPETQIGELGQNCTYILQDFTSLAVAEDGCSTPTVTQNPPAGTLLDVGSQQVTLTASDGIATTSCNFTVSIVDATPPTVNCANITVQLDEYGQYTLEPDDINAGSGDNCGIASTVIDVTTLDCSNVGTVDVTLTVTDTGGNSESCVATITVLSNANPNAVCHNVTVVLDEFGVGTLEGVELDNGSTGGCIFTVDIDTFDCDDVGLSIPVVMTVSNSDDSATSSCTAFVNVVDNMDPIVYCPQDTIIIADHAPYALPDFVLNETVTYTDNCSLQATYTQNPPIGTLIDAGETLVTVIISDPSANSTSCMFTVFLDPSLNTLENQTQDVVVFPNPATTSFSLAFAETLNIKTIVLYDIVGRKVIEFKTNNLNGSQVFDISELKSASYFLHIITDEGEVLEQVIKK